MSKPKSARMSVSLPESTKKTVEKLAAMHGMSASGYLQLLLERGLIIEAVIEKGDKLFIQTKDNQMLPIVDGDFEARPTGIMANLRRLLR